MDMTDKRDYYEVLGVSRTATEVEIKQAYRRLAREHHPDVNPGDSEAETRFKELNEAYQILSDGQKRQVYDRYGHGGINQQYGGQAYNAEDFGFGDIFEMFFGGMGGATSQRGQRRTQKGNDLRVDLELTLEECSTGVKKTIEYQRLENCETCKGSGAKPGSQAATCPMCHGAGQVRQQQQTFFGTQVRITTCPRCHGEGKIIETPCEECQAHGRTRVKVEKEVEIPAGVDSGMRIRIPGAGDMGTHGGPAGDVYIFVRVAKHETFERRDNDIWSQISISFPTAALGGNMTVPTLWGEEEIRIHPGTQPGEVITLKGKGMPDPSSHRKGNHSILVGVKTPTDLNEEQKELMRKLADSMSDEQASSDAKSFFERVKDSISGL